MMASMSPSRTRRDVVDGQADAVVGDAVLREVVGADLLAAVAGADLAAGSAPPRRRPSARSMLVHAGAEDGLALARFFGCERSSWQVTTMPVGLWVMRIAVATLFTFWPPAPPE